MRGTENAYKFWSEYLKGKDRLEDGGLDQRVILKWILGKYDGRVWDQINLARDRS